MSDIEIAREATMQPIQEIADKLEIPAEHISPYGRYKAKVSLDLVPSLQDRPDAKLILVTAITPTPAGEGKTTTSVGLNDALNRIGKQASRAVPRAAAMPRSCRWRTSTFTSPATSTPSALRTTCCPPCSTITSTGATTWASTNGASPGAAWST
jgi:hypothetical protein